MRCLPGGHTPAEQRGDGEVAQQHEHAADLRVQHAHVQEGLADHVPGAQVGVVAAHRIGALGGSFPVEVHGSMAV